ncbi:MAG: hypothetical protein ACUVUG_07580 [Candidatus Aminicenantia bacterium]
MKSRNKEEVINYSKNNEIKFHWNPLTQQPNIPYTKWQRNFEYLKHIGPHLQMIWLTVKLLPKLIPNYLTLLKYKEYTKTIQKGFCIGTDNDPTNFQKIIEEVKEIGARSLLLRIPVWDLETIDLCRDFLMEIKNSGIEPVVSILQDYNSTVNLKYWKNGVEKIIKGLENVCFHYVIGHAWNRYKWGVRSFLQYLDLVEKAEEVRKNFSGIKFIGPSVIDFEYICTAGVLNHKTRRPKFDIVNALLYVDRQGRPENKHMGFDLSKKSLLMRTIINSTYGEEIPFWITETNWPLKAKEEYVPTSLKESVDEETYADYLIRYYILSLTSGAERVYWWQLVAHGYGIIDNIDNKWRKRVSWFAFKTMSQILGSFRLIDRKIEKYVYSFKFENQYGKLITVAWSLKEKSFYPLNFEVKEVISRDGEPIKFSDSLFLSPSPVFIIHKT